MSSALPDDPLTTRTGSPEASSLLRANLTSIADQHRGTAMARLVREVLEGQRDLSDLEGDVDFARLMRSGVQQYEDHLATMSPEKKSQLYADAQQLVDGNDESARDHG